METQMDKQHWVAQTQRKGLWTEFYRTEISPTVKYMLAATAE